MQKFKLGEDKLTFEIVKIFLEGDVEVVVSPSKRKELEGVRGFVEDCLSSGETFYGINTGFGMLANKAIDSEKLEELQENLIKSHAFAVGEPFEVDVVKLMMLLRAHVLAMGFSGASLGVLDLLISMINKEIIPVIPSQGSVGASGDLSPLSYIALAMIGEGECIYDCEVGPSMDVLEKAGLKPVKLQAKDGLSLINGTQAMTSIAAIALLKAEKLIKISDLAAALTVEGMRGSRSPFDSDVHKIRHQVGQMNSAKMMRRLLKGSKIISEHKHCSRVQDPYSLRCIPQVHGAARDAFKYAKEIIGRELNACTDNPLVFPEPGKIISGGNFHGEPVAMAMDILAIAMAELGSISERRIEQLTNPKSDDLPVMFLTPNPGLNSGFMIPHLVASSLVSENKTLCHPASVDSIPTSAGQEDHVSMGMWAARKVLQVIGNLESICLIEMIAAAQAIDLHDKELTPGHGTSVGYKMVRKHFVTLEDDRWMVPEMEGLRRGLFEDTDFDEVEKEMGEWVI